MKVKNKNTYILPREALELIHEHNLISFYFESNFKKKKFRNKGVSVYYDYDEILDWIEEKYMENLYLNNPSYRKLLTDYESLNHEPFWL